MENARILAEPVDENSLLEPTELFTFWRATTASQIGRSFVPRNWTSLVQWDDVIEPPVDSDHQTATLLLKDGQ
ncbi:hypothetical protein CCR75_008921 [Bremia lactucae]|uniref:Uncharacterized protein n=1 Tax=Bremia lactucae TaxID=4779 RepID=A0A976IJE6_BRELC|nr:hypothetical protein CCR75_008921 [Bremia lactucae]